MCESESRRLFLVFCTEQRKVQYEAILEKTPYKFSYLGTVEELLYACRTESPFAVLVDIVSAARLGGALLTSLFEMEVNWPRLRCAVRPDGTATAMCNEPDWTGGLLEAIDGIGRGMPAWSLNRGRQDFRLPFKCRLRWRVADDNVWTLGNTLDLSSRGAFVVMYEPPVKGKRLEVEFHDLLAEPVRFEAVVSRVRRWHDGTDLPGAGLWFDPATMSKECTQAINNIIGFAALERKG